MSFDGNSIAELDTPITWDEVWTCVNLLPNGKAAGLDGITAELLKKAGVGYPVALASLFNQIWREGVWPSEWQHAYLLPLFKGAGEKSDPGNYRMIAIASQVAKIFEKVIDRRIRCWAERVGTLSDLQGGFREGRGTADQIFILHELVAKRTEQNLPTFLAFRDVRKANDKVWRAGLWSKLYKAGLGGRCLALLRMMLGKVYRSVMINGALSDKVEVEAGVPQGSVLSPLLYAHYINGLHDALSHEGLGVEIYGRRVPLLMYADDIVLIARDPTELANMLKVVEEYARRWRFDINHGKSGVVVVGPRKCKQEATNHKFSVAGGVLPHCDHYKYLGIEFASSRTSAKWNTYLNRIVKKASNVANQILWKGGGVGGLKPATYVHLWNAQVRPILEYAAELWAEDNVSKTVMSKVDSVRYNFGKVVLGLRHSSPAACAVFAELGMEPPEVRRHSLKLGYWARLCNAAKDRLLSLIFTRRHAEVSQGGAPRSCLQSFKSSLQDHAFGQEWDAKTAGPVFHRLAKEKIAAVGRRFQQLQILSKPSLSYFSSIGQDYSLGTALDLDDRNNLVGTRLLTRLRLGQAYLMERVASLMGLSRCWGRCRLCHGVCGALRPYLSYVPSAKRVVPNYYYF